MTNVIKKILIRAAKVKLLLSGGVKCSNTNCYKIELFSWLVAIVLFYG
jgi:hypothetical protein